MKEVFVVLGICASSLAVMFCIFKTIGAIIFFQEWRTELKDKLDRIETRLKEPKQ